MTANAVDTVDCEQVFFPLLEAPRCFSAAWTTVSSPTRNWACDLNWRWKQLLLHQRLKLIRPMIARSQTKLEKKVKAGNHQGEKEMKFSVVDLIRARSVRLFAGWWKQSWRRNYLPLKCSSFSNLNCLKLQEQTEDTAVRLMKRGEAAAPHWEKRNIWRLNVLWSLFISKVQVQSSSTLQTGACFSLFIFRLCRG